MSPVSEAAGKSEKHMSGSGADNLVFPDESGINIHNVKIFC